MCLVWHLKMKNAIILKMEGEGWSELWTGSVPELKEEKRIVGEVSWGQMDTEKPGWAKRKMWWEKKIRTSLYSFFLPHGHAICTPK